MGFIVSQSSTLTLKQTVLSTPASIAGVGNAVPKAMGLVRGMPGQACPRRRAGVACDERTTAAVGKPCSRLGGGLQIDCITRDDGVQNALDRAAYGRGHRRRRGASLQCRQIVTEHGQQRHA